MTEIVWKSVRATPPPPNKKVMVWGMHGTRFGYVDGVGQWHRQHGGPMPEKPTLWTDTPAPSPEERAKA